MAPKARVPRGTEHASFRPDIEGLRGVAVIGVVIFHALPGVLPGGYVGVDVFFVISGFLITGMLLREIDTAGTIALAGFWARRVRRILPVASFVLIATAIAAAILLPPVEMQDAGEGIAAAAGFAENWRLVANAVDYLRQDASPSVVLHYWSLGVEEQFYLLWPLLLLAAAFAARRLGGGSVRPRVLWATMIGLWLLSFAASLYYTAALPPFAFFSTVTRIWQLLSGALVALAGTRLLVMPERLRSVIVTLALAVLLASMGLITSDTPYPGLAALAPTLATACLIAFGGVGATPLVAERVLALSPLTGVGRLSYSWYLWHWPFLIFGAVLGAAGAWQNGLLALAALGAGVLTYWFVEAPVRFNPALMRSPRRSLLLGCVLVGVSVGAGLALLAYAARTPILLSDGTRLNAKKLTKDRPVIYRDGCFLSQSEIEYGPCVYGDPAGKRAVVLFGDSHAAQFFPALDRAAKEAGWRLVVRAKSACPPTDFLIWGRGLKRAYRECADWRDKVLRELSALKPDMVVLGSESNFFIIDSDGKPVTPAEIPDLAAQGELQILAKVLATGARVVVLRDTLYLPEQPITCLRAHPKEEQKCVWRRDAVLRQIRYPFANLDQVEGDITVVDVDDKICDATLCPLVRDGTVIMFDRAHLSATFAKTLAPFFVDLMKGSDVR